MSKTRAAHGEMFGDQALADSIAVQLSDAQEARRAVYKITDLLWRHGGHHPPKDCPNHWTWLGDLIVAGILAAESGRAADTGGRQG